jgi:cell division protein FtsB
MKIDIKIIVIVALSLLTILFVFLWWRGGNDFLEKENRRLNTEIKKIQEQRDSLQVERKILEAEYKTIQERIKDKERFKIL